MTIAICDDEKAVADTLERIVNEVVIQLGLEDQVTVLKHYSADSLLMDVEEFDIVFLDIEMPGMDGIEAGKQICKRNSECKIIIATGREERYKEAFKISAFRFITKPFLYEEVYAAMEDYQNYQIGSETIELYYNRKSYLVQQKDIVYLISMQGDVEVYAQKKVFRYAGSLLEIKKILNKVLFFQIRRGIIINLYHVKKYTGGKITIGNTVFKVARRMKTSFEEAYIKFDITYRG